MGFQESLEQFRYIHKPPGENEADNVNRKSFHLIILQMYMLYVVMTDYLKILTADGLDVSMMQGCSGTLKFANARHSYVEQIIL